MADLPGREVQQQGGDAVGRLRGINHLAFFTHDMEATVRFYRDILGLKVVRTNGRVSTLRYVSAEPAEAHDDFQFERQYFFELPNGELFSLYEVTPTAGEFDASIVSHLWPPMPERVRATPIAQKLDHLAFDVASREDLEWFRRRLEHYDVPVSKIIERNIDPDHSKFVKSIYFYDPSGNPLEIATIDENDPEWVGYDYAEWFRDTNPVPALTEAVDERG